MIIKLPRSTTSLTATVLLDSRTMVAVQPFDLDLTKPVTFTPWHLDIDMLPSEWNLGVIVGASGSGKSTLLKNFRMAVLPIWESGRSIVYHFADAPTAIDRLTAVGLNSVPTWRKPYAVLSTGEKFRADLARVIGNDVAIDEYTSVVSRSVAMTASYALSRWVHINNIHGLVLATCHHDVVEWLKPSWIVDTNAGVLTAADEKLEPIWKSYVESKPIATINWTY